MSRDRALGVRAITIYKFAKAGVQLVLGAVLCAGLIFGFAGALNELAISLRMHMNAAWAVSLAELLVKGTDHKHLIIALGALWADSFVSAIEGWALMYGHWWGPWLVVGATGSLLPWEIFELIRFQKISRLVLFLVNIVIVVYLAGHALKLSQRSDTGIK